ncbi:MAG: hypothetical protein M1833_004883 [Piccolia ochrophora]|nr:MAG: hypothetical protein M1833_004883 [Piccolia ochrophora]
MGVMKQFLPLLAVAGVVFAQNGCDSDSNDVQNQGDADALANCQTVSGDIVISSRVGDTLQLDGIQELEGDLVVKDAQNLTSLSANDLATIGGNFILDGVTSLQNLNFPSLTECDQISWRAVPQLSELSFTAGVTKASAVLITNTGLNSLAGINLESVKKFDVNNNRYLKTIDVQLGSITELLNIQANGQGVAASFPNLEWAFNLTFRECSSVKLPSLESVNSTMGFFDNTIQKFSAPNLTLVGKDLTFTANDELTELDFPKLKTINGGFTITNNTKLESIEGFDKLEKVGGAVTAKGVFDEASLPALEDVKGGFVMASTGDFDCGPFDKLKNQQVQGKYGCKGNLDKSVATATGSSDQASSTETDAASNIKVNHVVLGFAAVAAGLVGLSV